MIFLYAVFSIQIAIMRHPNITSKQHNDRKGKQKTGTLVVKHTVNKELCLFNLRKKKKKKEGGEMYQRIQLHQTELNGNITTKNRKSRTSS